MHSAAQAIKVSKRFHFKFYAFLMGVGESRESLVSSLGDFLPHDKTGNSQLRSTNFSIGHFPREHVIDIEGLQHVLSAEIATRAFDI
jgi:hypothetical protein